MLSMPILKQDMRINMKGLTIIYGIQLSSLLLAAGIRSMRLIEISDIFWDTIPVIIVPIAMIIFLCWSLVSRSEQEKTMEFMLATSIKPKKIILTKIIFLILNVLALNLFSILIGCAGHIYDLTGIWKRNTYLWLNTGGVCLQIFWCGYCMMIACMKKKSGTLFFWKAGALIPLVFYGIYLLYFLVPQLFFLRYLTIFSLFEQSQFSQLRPGNLIGIFVLLVTGAVMLAAAGRIFCRRHPQM